MHKTLYKNIRYIVQYFFNKLVDKFNSILYNKVRSKITKHKKTEDKKMMYTVWAFDEMVFDDVVLFTGTLAQCKEFKGTDDELYVVAPDGFTVVA